MTESAWKDRNADPARLLSRAAEVISPDLNSVSPSTGQAHNGSLRVGVDLGTAYTVLVVLNEQDNPLIGEYRFSQWFGTGWLWTSSAQWIFFDR
ncbi:MAG: hypothetical protein U9R53_04810 [Chloroflexota bacterium]|nr:hypothetical protein [Chloroflexota bacterium]